MRNIDPRAQRVRGPLLTEIRSTQRQLDNVMKSLGSSELDDLVASDVAIERTGGEYYEACDAVAGALKSLRVLDRLARKWGAR